jgi:hypothetical protein
MAKSGKDSVIIFRYFHILQEMKHKLIPKTVLSIINPGLGIQC